MIYVNPAPSDKVLYAIYNSDVRSATSLLAHFRYVMNKITLGEIPEGLRNDAAMYAGCVSGALQLEDYLDIVRKAGFRELIIQVKKKMDLEEEIYMKYFSREEMEAFMQSNKGIFSITLNAKK